MAKKLNQSLLNEELKRFRLISEYSFYTEEPKKDDDLILGSNIEEVDEKPAVDQSEPEDDSKTAANQFDTDAPEETGDEQGGDANLFATDDAGDETNPDVGGEETESPDELPQDDLGMQDTEMSDIGAEAKGDEVEVDVTQIVKGTEDAKKSADLSVAKTSELLDKFSELERRVSAMDAISTKIQDLEKEIVKRNPTPVEKLEMKSLSSFPYNIKLSDYWKDVPGYEATPEEQQPKEYVLTKDDVDSGYTDASIKSTFDVPEDYEEI